MRRALVIGAALAIGLTTTAAMKWNQHVQEEQAGLLARATVKADQAEALALKAVPGKVIESEIEEENGVLLYSFEIETADGVREVEINAETGAVVSIENEDDEDDEDDDDKGDDDRR